MEDSIPVPAIIDHYFTFEEHSTLDVARWTESTVRSAGMYGIALALTQGRHRDIAINIFDNDTALELAGAATNHQNATVEIYGYTNPVLVVNPDGTMRRFNDGITPGQL